MQEKKNRMCVCVDIATKGRSVQREKVICRNAAMKKKCTRKQLEKIIQDEEIRLEARQEEEKNTI